MGEMTFDLLLAEQSPALTRRLRRIVGDHATAEDLCQETLMRAWRSAPRDGGPPRLRAWLYRTGTNLALDELRRRRRREHVPLPLDLAARDDGPADPVLRAAIDALTPHQRLVLLLRFQAGLSLRELADVLDLTEEAARKRVARARAAFLAAHRRLLADDDRPTVLVLLGREDGEPYRRWLEAAGARARIVDATHPGLDMAGADALVLSGSHDDIHPSLYGADASPHLAPTDLTRDLRDLAALRAALRADLPVVGICRGPQLINVLFGGDLHQHLPEDGYADLHHLEAPHDVETTRGSLARRVLGASVDVVSGHHQAVRRVGRGLRVTSVAPDGLPETLEVPGRRFALGVQWHPERRGAEQAGQRLAQALVEAAA